MKPKGDHTETGRAATPAPRKRFRIDRLEERIAPKKGGKKTLTANCASDSGGYSGY